MFDFAGVLEVHSFIRVKEVNSCSRGIGKCRLLAVLNFARVMKVHSSNRVFRDVVYFAKLLVIVHAVGRGLHCDTWQFGIGHK